MTHKAPSLFDWKIAGPAMIDAFKKLNPAAMIKNPVMFVTLVGAILTTVDIFLPTGEGASKGTAGHADTNRRPQDPRQWKNGTG
jgi:high-affinity K+ transport system ATPase subunit B